MTSGPYCTSKATSRAYGKLSYSWQNYVRATSDVTIEKRRRRTRAKNREIRGGREKKMTDFWYTNTTVEVTRFCWHFTINSRLYKFLYYCAFFSLVSVFESCVNI